MSRIPHNKENLATLKFNKLLVLDENLEPRKYGNSNWNCLCDCGNIIKVSGNKLKSGHTKSCGCLKLRHDLNWRSTTEISKAFYRTIVRNANDRNLSFDISVEDIWKIFLKQNRKCALSNRLLNFSDNYDKNPKSQTASLDRIDSSKVYEISNIQWIHKDLQRMKMDMNQEEFIRLCKLVTEKFK